MVTEVTGDEACHNAFSNLIVSVGQREAHC